MEGEGLVKKKIAMMIFAVSMLSLMGCNNDDNSVLSNSYDSLYSTEDNTEDSLSDKGLDSDYRSSYSSSGSSSSSSSSSGNSSNYIEHYCAASGCMKEGVKAVTGLSGYPEYYCQDHYDELQDMISDMEEDVGNGSYSQHKCEECSKEGTREITGLDGNPEYYCTEHYNQLVDLVNELYEK